MDATPIFETLKAIFKNHEPKLQVIHDTVDNYYLHTPATEKNIKGEFFGAVQIKKNYVSFHLMPIYYYPELIADVSVELKKCMQGKSCFNFKKIDDNLFSKLNSLTKKSFAKYKALKKV